MDVVEYYKEYKNEVPFMMGGQKYVYCWGKYPDGAVDIAVYSYANDLAYDYNDFRIAMGIDKDSVGRRTKEDPSITNMINQHDEEQKNKYAASNMDDIEAGAIRETKNNKMNESEVIKNAATKHILKGMGAEAPKNTVGTQPTTGGQVIKNAATKDMAKGKGETLKGEKSLEEPKKVDGVVKNAATKNVQGGKTAGPASQNIEKQPTTGGQSVKNAATKDMSKTIKNSPSTAPKPKVVAEDLDTNDGVNKMDEDNEVIKNAATKSIKGGKTEVGGKSSGLKNMEEKSELALRAGAKGKVYESEMEEEGWMSENEMEEGMEGAQSRVAEKIMTLLAAQGIGSVGLADELANAMANPSQDAIAKAKEMLGSETSTNDSEMSDMVAENETPTTEELLIGLAAVVTMFGALGVSAFKDKIIAAIKKALGMKGSDTVKEYTDEHPVSTHNAVNDMPTPPSHEEAMANQVYEEVEELEEEDSEEQMKEDKLNEAINRMKQILKY